MIYVKDIKNHFLICLSKIMTRVVIMEDKVQSKNYFAKKNFVCNNLLIDFFIFSSNEQITRSDG